MFRGLLDTDKRAAAIVNAARLGRRIQAEYPQVARDYRGKPFLRDLVQTYDLARRYGITPDQALRSLHFAIRGYSGVYGTEGYEGLIPRRSLIRIGKRKIRDNGKKCKNEKRGLFGLSPEERQAARLKGNVNKGDALWTPEEERDLVRMYYNTGSEYRYPPGRNGGKPNLLYIGSLLDEIYHTLEYGEETRVRTSNKINLKLDAMKRKGKLEALLISLGLSQN